MIIKELKDYKCIWTKEDVSGVEFYHPSCADEGLLVPEPIFKYCGNCTKEISKQEERWKEELINKDI